MLWPGNQCTVSMQLDKYSVSCILWFWFWFCQDKKKERTNGHPNFWAMPSSQCRVVVQKGTEHKLFFGWTKVSSNLPCRLTAVLMWRKIPHALHLSRTVNDGAAAATVNDSSQNSAAIHISSKWVIWVFLPCYWGENTGVEGGEIFQRLHAQNGKERTFNHFLCEMSGGC